MLLFSMALALSLQVSPLQQAPPAPAPRPAPRIYNETADANAAIDAAIKSAALDEIRVLINWGANDSERSVKFAALRSTRELGSFFTDEYKVVPVNVGHGDRRGSSLPRPVLCLAMNEPTTDFRQPLRACGSAIDADVSCNNRPKAHANKQSGHRGASWFNHSRSASPHPSTVA